MGTSEAEAEALKAQAAVSFSDEKPQQPVFVSDFAIARYPVTNADFRRFIEDGGYTNPIYWLGDAGRWLKGAWWFGWPDLRLRSRLEPILWWALGFVVAGLRPKAKRTQPWFWDDSKWNADNQPVVGVTWYEAQAYCLWLTTKLRAAGLLTSEQAICLPTEAEWEKAARTPPPAHPPAASRSMPGEGSYLWPWGDTWDPNKCNSEESGFNATTPVGMYPDGASPLGITDMVGNVWEWCGDWWQDDLYKEREGKEVRDPIGPFSGSARVVRGGSWNLDRWFCRSAYRYGLVPASFLNGVGFRLACSPVRT